MSTMTVSRVSMEMPVVRLTRRGRLLLTAVVLLALVVAAVLLSGGAPARAGTALRLP